MNLSSDSLEQFYHQLHSGARGLHARMAWRRVAAQKRKTKTESRFRREAKLLLNQFRSPLMLLLILFVILSAFLGDTYDAVIMLVILLISALLSFYQELHAGNPKAPTKNGRL